MRKIIKDTFKLTVFTLIIWLIYKEIIDLSLIEKLSNNKRFSENFTEIFITILLIPLIYLLSVLINYVITLEKTVGSIDTIQSKVLREKGIDYVSEATDKIANKFNTMLTGERTKNVLWELEQLELAELEIESHLLNINNDSLTKDQKEFIDKIKDKINKSRRDRITQIANKLIYKGNINKKIYYFATETKKPSEIESADKTKFRNEQIKILKRFKPEIVRRVLILKKIDFIDEYEKHINSLKDFIDWNNKRYDNYKKILLNFIIYDDNVDIRNVFVTGLNGFYDFAISKYGNKKLVFAQKDDILTIFDYENPSNKKSIDKFDKAFSDFVNIFEDINKNYVIGKKIIINNNNSNSSIFYSKVIESIEDAKSFYEFIK